MDTAEVDEEDSEIEDIVPPWEQLFPRQLEVFNAGIESHVSQDHPDCPTVLILDGPRKSSKTIAVCHRILRHMWETPKARVALFVKTTGSATDGGVWLDMVDIVIPIWLEANFGFEYTTFDLDGIAGPKTDSKTRTIYFRTTNAHGGESELRLLSLHDEGQVKAKLRSTRYSCIWFSELANFKDPNVFRVSWQQLRMWNMPPWQHMWVGDTNPAEEGEDSWIYQLAYVRKGKIMESHQNEGAGQFARSIHHIPFKLSDNLALTEVQKQAMAALYSDDEGEYAREYEGKWVKGHGSRDKHFADIFSPSIHVIGSIEEGASRIQLHPNTDMLFTGWDIGASVNHAAGIVEKRIATSKDGSTEWSYFCVLDEMHHTNEHMTITDMAIEMLEKMEECVRGHPLKIEWEHYSDEDATTVWRRSSETFDALELADASNGVIELTGVSKPAGSVRGRVRLIRRLLREQRLFIAARCVHVIAMMENLRKGPQRVPGTPPSQAHFVQWGEYKHDFDWLSYVLWMECASELESHGARPIEMPDDISVPL